MGYNFYKVLIGFTTITAILAAFNDFVIKNEKDLQRFDVSNEDVLQYDETMYDELFYKDLKDKEELNGLAGKCGDNGGLNPNYETYGADFTEIDDLSIYEDNIDGRVFIEIMRLLANEPDVQKLQNYLGGNEGYNIHKHFKDLSYQDVENDFGNDADDCLFL